MDEFLGDEVNKNIGYVEQTAFVSKMPKGVIPYCSIRFDNEYFHIYKAPRNAAGYYYIKQSTKHKECFSYMGGRNVFGTLEGLKEDEYCIEKTGLIKALTRRMYEGELRYVDINVKFRFMNALINAKK